MDWTEDRVATLRTLWLDGQSASQVARQLGGVSRNAVIGKVHRIGLAGRDLPAKPRALGGMTATRAKPRTAASSLPNVTTSLARARLARSPRPDLPATATLLTLALEACRWPVGDPQEAGFGFCGRAGAGKGSYCPDHARLSLRRTAEPRPASDGSTARRLLAGPMTFARGGGR